MFAQQIRALEERMTKEERGTYATDLQGPPSECMQTEKLQDLKKLAQ
jgi:hypothetical protein